MFEMLGSLASGIGSLFSGSSAASSSAASSSAFGNFASGAGSSLVSGLVNGLAGDFFGKRSRRDSAQVSYNNYLKQMAADYTYQNGKGFLLAQKYNNANYELARRYSENSASWARRGLENAGLNPVLAASQGFNANMGQQGVAPLSSSASLPSVSGSNPHLGVNLSAAMRDMAGLDVQSSTASKLKADTNVAQATADFIKANTKRVEADTLNTLTQELVTRENLGFTGTAAPVGRALKFIGETLGEGSAKAFEANPKAVNAIERIGDFVRGNDFLQSFNPAHFIGKFFGGTSATQDGHNAKTIKPAVHDLHTAKEISDEISPSPYPVIRTDRNGSSGRVIRRYDPTRESYSERRKRLRGL